MQKNDLQLRKYEELPDQELGIHIVHRRGICSGPIFEKHWHDHWQLILFKKGHTVMHCHQGTVALQAGNIALVNSGEIHYMDRVDTWEQKENALEFIILKVSPTFLQGRFFQPLVDLRYVFANCIDDDSYLRKCICQLLREYERRAVGWELAMRSLVLALFTHLLRHHVGQVLTVDESVKQQERWRRMGKVLEYMEKCYAAEIPLARLTQIACQSTAHFCRNFKKLTGFSSREYLLRIRIQNAQSLLRESGKSIAEIGYAVGFQDNNYFSRAFKRIQGCTPGQYREALTALA
jgi:AraC-like DNA-binding protein